MTTIYLIRHAEAEGNLYRRIHGWYDALVTENGLRQIQALEQRFQGEHFDAVWSSDLYRTCTTARAVYEPRGLELRTDPELWELNMGDWEDQTWGQVRRTQPGELDRFNRSDPTWTAPRGEGLGELGERVERALRRIAAAHPDQTVAVFSHGTAIRQALARIKGIPPEEWHGLRHSDNTAVSCLKWDGAAFQLAFEGDAPGGVTCAMAGDRMAGLIQLDPERYAKDGAGYIPFCYIVPQLRAQGLGVQLIGQAVSFYRPLGRQYLRLRCASYNTPAQHFYQRYGFYKIGEEQGSRVPLDILEKYIGYDH